MIKGFAKIFLISILVSSLMVSFLSFPSSAETIVTESEIAEDTTWTVFNSPYKIMNNITVTNGTTLTIEPGVEIQFDKNVKLNVKGSLVANGSSTERIEFKPISMPTAPLPQALWEGLGFAGESTDIFTIRFADIMFARNGATINSTGKATIENTQIMGSPSRGVYVIGQASLIVRNNDIHFNRNGIATTGNVTSGMEITQNAIYDNENGVNIAASGSSCRVHSVVIAGNNISSTQDPLRLRRKGDGIRVLCNASTLEGLAQISEVSILNNIVLQNEYGIRLYASGMATINNSIVSGNIISFNTMGMRCFSGGNASSSINMILYENLVFSNGDGMSLEAAGPSAMSYDFLIQRNIVSANNVTGVEVLSGTRINLTENAIAYNSYGLVVKSQGNLARRNDIYENTVFGAYVEGSGAISAVDNYWGNSSGPFHEYLNMNGKGNEINGNGADLSFNPFLQTPTGVYPINEPPVANLIVATTGAIKEFLVFDASDSHDDRRVVRYFFDFGDGQSGWTDSSTVEYAYVAPGFFDVSLTVMDDLGVLSRNRIVVRINVTFPILTVYIAMKPNFVLSGGSASVVVRVTNGSYAVEGVMINVTSDVGGTFEKDSGATDANGGFEVMYFPPKVSKDTLATITVSASKGGFINGSKQVLFPVLMPTVNWLASPWVWSAVIGVAVAVSVSVFLFRRRQNRKRRLAKIRSRRD